jgi:hypothetical protein
VDRDAGDSSDRDSRAGGVDLWIPAGETLVALSGLIDEVDGSARRLAARAYENTSAGEGREILGPAVHDPRFRILLPWKGGQRGL